MSKFEGFKVEISSDFDEFWCYNILVTCGCFDVEGRQVGFASADDTIAPVGSNLDRKPSDYPSKRVVKFETSECDHLHMYIYVIPHTIPLNRDVDESTPYMLNVKISRAGEVVLKRKFSVNRWSGASLEVNTGKL